MVDIIVIGSFVMDAVATMDRYPQAGETVLGNDINFYPGGKGINQCVTVARMGGKAEMIGSLGKDANAKVFLEIMEKENIVYNRVFFCDKPTAMAQIQINSDGQNRICVIPSANYQFGFEQLEAVKNVFTEGKIVIFQLEMQRDVTFEAIRIAHESKCKVILNPAPAFPLPDEILSCTDYLTPNETELALLSGCDVTSENGIRAGVKNLLNRGAKCVITTVGEKGAIIGDSNGIRHIAGFKVTPVDTVAAGDSFNGALAVALAENKTIEEAVLFANACGALTVQRKGAIPSIGTRSEVIELLNKTQRTI